MPVTPSFMRGYLCPVFGSNAPLVPRGYTPPPLKFIKNIQVIQSSRRINGAQPKPPHHLSNAAQYKGMMQEDNL